MLLNKSVDAAFDQLEISDVTVLDINTSFRLKFR
jgi:hypothetical protein